MFYRSLSFIRQDLMIYWLNINHFFEIKRHFYIKFEINYCLYYQKDYISNIGGSCRGGEVVEMFSIDRRVTKASLAVEEPTERAGIMDEQIRRATINDCSMLANLIRSAFKTVAVRFSLTPLNCPSHPSNCRAEWIQDAMAKGVEYYIMTQYDQPIGCVALQKANRDVFYMERLAVLPEFRDHGYGRMLVEHCLEIASQRKAKRVEAGVIADQTELIEWYRRLGFRFKQRARLHDLPFTVAFIYFDLQEEWSYASESA
ncbi:MAG: GNAT family N-acetyltransferase [Calditrichaeota bacterium]|nr:MAG: GNAT family N-acetyltransferase [Calditrichota bacterium]